jgi:hypothetical protein
MYKRIEPKNLVVGKTYFIVPTARLISNNKKNVQSIPENLKKRFLFPEGKLETMEDVPEGSSYAESVSKRPGYEFMRPSYYRWLPACAFTGLNSHGKPLLKSVKNFVYGHAKAEGYTFFSTELTPDPAAAPVQVVLPETPAPPPSPAPAPVTTATVEVKMSCPNCGKCLEVENGLLKFKIKSD